MAEIRVTADTKQAQRELNSLHDSLKGLASIAIGAGISQQLLQLTSQVQELNNKLIFASGGIEQANAAFGLLAKTAQATGSNLGGTVDLYSKLATSATFAGSSQESLAKITENFNKTLQISGASGAGAAAALYQFAQAIQKGNLNGDEFRTIMETNGYLMKVLETQTGKSRSELIQMASQGRLSAEIVGKALLTATQISEDYAKTTRTIPQAFENLNTSVLIAVNNFNKLSGAGDLVVKALDWFSKHTGALIGAILGVAGAVTILTINLIGLRTALVSSGIGALVVGLGVALGFAAEKLGLFGDIQKDTEDATKKSTEALKKEQEALLKGLKVTPQKTQQQLDYNKQLQETIAKLQNALNYEKDRLKYGDLEASIRKTIADEQIKAEKAGSSLSATQKERIRNLILETEQIKLFTELSKESKNIQNEFNNLLIFDVAKRKEAEIIQQNQLKYGAAYTGELQKQVEKIAQQAGLLAQVQQGIGIATPFDKGIIQAQYDAEQAALDAALEQKRISQEAYELAIFDLKQKYRDKNAQADAAKYAQEFRSMGFGNKKAAEMAKQRTDVEKMSKEEQIQFGLETYGKMLNDLGSFNKDAFKAAKAFNIAMAIMDTYKAATSAFAALAGIPIIGPALGAVAAGAAIAAGMARVAAIRSQSYSGRQLGGPVMGGDSYIVGENGPEIFTPNTTGSITRNQDIGGGEPVNINFNINTVDAKGFDTLLATRKPLIIQMVRTAMNDRGNRSLV